MSAILDYTGYPTFMPCNGDIPEVDGSNTLNTSLALLFLTSKGSGLSIDSIAPLPEDYLLSKSLDLVSSNQWELTNKGYQVNSLSSPWQYCSSTTTIANPGTILATNVAFTIAFLCKTPSSYNENAGLFMKSDSAYAWTRGYGLHYTSGVLKGWVDSPSNFVSLTPGPTNEWVLWVLRYDTTGIDLFRRTSTGLVQGTRTNYAANTLGPTNRSSLFIGTSATNSQSSYSMNAPWTMFGLWNRALSNSEIGVLGDNPFQLVKFPKSKELKLIEPASGQALSMYIPSGYNIESGITIWSLHGTQQDNELTEMGISETIYNTFNDPNWGILSEESEMAVVCPRLLFSGATDGSGRGPASCNYILDEDNILHMMTYLESFPVVGNNRKITGHSSGGSEASIIGIHLADKFNQICVRHSTGWGDDSDPFSLLLNYCNFNMNTKVTRPAWGPTGGPYIPGTIGISPNLFCGNTASGTYSWTTDPLPKQIEILIINGQLDPYTVDNPNTYAKRAQAFVNLVKTYGYNRVYAVVYQTPLVPGTANYDSPSICAVTTSPTYPHHCHCKDRLLAVQFFQNGIAAFTSRRLHRNLPNSDSKLMMITNFGCYSTTISNYDPRWKDAQIIGGLSTRIDVPDTAPYDVSQYRVDTVEAFVKTTNIPYHHQISGRDGADFSNELYVPSEGVDRTLFSENEFSTGILTQYNNGLQGRRSIKYDLGPETRCKLVKAIDDLSVQPNSLDSEAGIFIDNIVHPSNQSNPPPPTWSTSMRMLRELKRVTRKRILINATPQFNYLTLQDIDDIIKSIDGIIFESPIHPRDRNNRTAVEACMISAQAILNGGCLIGMIGINGDTESDLYARFAMMVRKPGDPIFVDFVNYRLDLPAWISWPTLYGAPTAEVIYDTVTCTWSRQFTNGVLTLHWPPSLWSYNLPSTGTTGVAVTLTANISDAPGQVKLRVAWGDAMTEDTALGGNRQVSLNHTYSSTGTKTVTLTPIGSDGQLGIAISLTITIS